MNTMSEKKSIGKLINMYRECSRSLWNEYFMERFENTHDWSLADSFKTIKEELFYSIVLSSSPNDGNLSFSLGEPSHLITVKLAEKYQTAVKINRVKGETAGYWDHPVTKLNASSVLGFVDLFDWNSYGFLDMSLVMCEVFSNPEYPSIEGHRLIVELMYVDVVLAV